MTRRRFQRRGPGDRFLLIPFELLGSLPEQHVAVLIDLCKRHNGLNNGAIGYGWRDANKAARVSRGGRILDDLRQRGIIRLSRDARFNMKSGRRIREWEVPFLDWDNPAFKGIRKLRLDYWLLNSTAFGSLRAGEKKLLIELMRRYDGGNNSDIAFGIESGVAAGLSRTTTSRALSKLKRLGFIAETAPADPQHQRSRRWRLTMYPAGRPATKEFMRWKSGLENSFPGCSGATEPPVSAALVQPPGIAAERVSDSVDSQIRPSNNEISGFTESSLGSSRAAQSSSNSFPGAAHIEASQGLPRAQPARATGKALSAPSPIDASDPRALTASSPIPQSLLPSDAENCGLLETTDKPTAPPLKTRCPSRTADARQGDLEPVVGLDTPRKNPAKVRKPEALIPETAASYRGGVLPEELRTWSRDRRRAACFSQELVAKRIGLSRSQLANAEAGRFGLSPEAAARFISTVAALPYRQGQML